MDRFNRTDFEAFFRSMGRPSTAELISLGVPLRASRNTSCLRSTTVPRVPSNHSTASNTSVELDPEEINEIFRIGPISIPQEVHEGHRDSHHHDRNSETSGTDVRRAVIHYDYDQTHSDSSSAMERDSLDDFEILLSPPARTRQRAADLTAEILYENGSWSKFVRQDDNASATSIDERALSAVWNEIALARHAVSTMLLLPGEEPSETSNGNEYASDGPASPAQWNEVISNWRDDIQEIRPFTVLSALQSLDSLPSTADVGVGSDIENSNIPMASGGGGFTSDEDPYYEFENPEYVAVHQNTSTMRSWSRPWEGFPRDREQTVGLAMGLPRSRASRRSGGRKALGMNKLFTGPKRR